MSGWANAPYTNVSISTFPSQLDCSGSVSGSVRYKSAIGVGVSPVTTSAWPAVQACCPNSTISMTSATQLNDPKGIACQAWCMTAVEDVYALNTCFQDYKIGNTAAKNKTVFNFVDCADGGSKACSGIVVQSSSSLSSVVAPSSSLASLSIPTSSTSTTASSTVSSGLAAPTQIKKAAGFLVLMLSVMAVAA